MKSNNNEKHEDSLEMLMNDIKHLKVLNRKEEIEYFKRIENGDLYAKQFVAQHNLKLVISIAKKKNYSKNNLEMCDLIQRGYEGLNRAIEKFDYKKGFKFSTYAIWWIRQFIQREIDEQNRNIKLPVHITELIRKKKHILNKYKYDENQPSPQEIADELEITLDKLKTIKDIEHLYYSTISLSTPISEDAYSESELIDIQTQTTFKDSQEIYQNSELSLKISQMLSKLDKKERHTITQRFGINTGYQLTYTDIGVTLNLSRERIRQIYNKAIKKCREYCENPKNNINLDFLLES